jgi:regulator of PEP synthase PpsR (kinase-PPPase family)
MVKSCRESEVEYHDLWGRLLEKLEGYFDATRTGVPGKRQIADERYMGMIECIEYTRTLDDGVLPHLWAEADIIILGPSRTGKTPLSFFMSQRGYKVANYPIVPDESLPKELWDFDQERVFALTIDASKLSSIRSNRMQTLKMGSNTKYAQTSKIQQELSWCRRLYQKNPKWKVIDTTYAGIEESSAAIMKHLDSRGYRSRIEDNDNPSAI